jgi:hypothetical protein
VRIHFDITKHLACSRGNVIANYLDLEHLDMHRGLADCELLSEDERTACFTLRSKIGPFPFKNVHHYEFRPPDEIVNAIRSPFGPMKVVSTVREIRSDDSPVRCEVDVHTEIDLPFFVVPFRGLLEHLLRRVNREVLEEDREILERRQRLFGDTVDDYLRDGQFLLFKETFRKHYARRPQ